MWTRLNLSPITTIHRKSERTKCKAILAVVLFPPDGFIHLPTSELLPLFKVLPRTPRTEKVLSWKIYFPVKSCLSWFQPLGLRKSLLWGRLKWKRCWVPSATHTHAHTIQQFASTLEFVSLLGGDGVLLSGAAIYAKEQKCWKMFLEAINRLPHLLRIQMPLLGLNAWVCNCKF